VTLIVQSPVRPRRVLAAIVDAVSPDTTSLAYAVAYVTNSGSRLLVEKLQQAAEHGWEDQEKTIITCFDYAYTEPSALTFLQNEGFSIRIANLDASSKPRISPSATGFHPKFYVAQRPSNDAVIVTGSANLTRRALTVNYEAVSVSVEPYAHWFSTWRDLRDSAVLLSQSLLEAYIDVRSHISRSIPDEPPVPSPLPSPTDVDTLEHAVRDHGLDPATFSGFWIEVGYASGGSGNQVELPRLASRFFGFEFDDYGSGRATIGNPSIGTGLHHSVEKRLAWHGNNGMERLYVPTVQQGGQPVMRKVAFFQRSADYFIMSVVEPESYEHQEWRESSASTGTLFKLGRTSTTMRQCGLV